MIGGGWIKRGDAPAGGPLGALSMLGVNPEQVTEAIAGFIERFLMALEHIGGAAEAISVQLEHQSKVLVGIDDRLCSIEQSLQTRRVVIGSGPTRMTQAAVSDAAPKKKATKKKAAGKKKVSK